MRVLVTGAAGFIGSEVCRQLSGDGVSVRAVDCLLPDSYSAVEKQRSWNSLAGLRDIELVDFDLRQPVDKDLLEGIDVIINEAGMPGLAKSWDEFEIYSSCNLSTVANLLSSASIGSKPHFVQISTSSVYGKDALGNESQVPLPVSPYGVTKLAAEELLKAYSRSFGVPYTILRYFSVYGPGQRPDMAYRIFINDLLQDRPVKIFGDGSQSRTNTYVADCARATIRAAFMPAKGSTYNIAGDTEATLLEALRIIENILGRKAQIEFLERRAGDQLRTVGVTDKAQREIGFKSEIRLEEGLANQVAWQKSTLLS